jgi:uncharacterized Ntn-hydrolase superfamily protein
VQAQDTFSIVGLDTLTGEVGSAGASCVDLTGFGSPGYSFIGDLIPGIGAINTQAAYLGGNQVNARTRMNAGDTPAQIIAWLQANDVGSDPTIRQYGIAAMISGTPQTAAFTGSNCMTYKNHIVGRNYTVQGNILLGQKVLDSMEKKFKTTPGTLACKLMAALQGAKMVGADSRCASNNSSALFAYVKVSKPDDAYGNPYITIGVKTATNAFIEPIDSLQKIANSINLCGIVLNRKEVNAIEALRVFPNPAANSVSILNYSMQQTEKVVFINSVGQKVMEIENPGNRAIDISQLGTGIYFMAISLQGSQQKKIVKLNKD